MGVPSLPRTRASRVGRKSGADRDVGRPHCKRIEGRRDQRPNARVGSMTGIPIEAVQLGFALTKIDVDAGLGKGIVARDRGTQLPAINTNLSGKRFEDWRANKIAIVEELCRIAMARIHDAQTIPCGDNQNRKSTRRGSTVSFCCIQTLPARSHGKRQPH